ncbi:hypothetical protein Cni_G14091 [Canna indica]|uniref:Uncharacterized protein n=1 Tax=Canna indica TaxID=4628 RepID=A0AAQ3KDW6_9LILI|nr:hypothetical protein Cni_G14091 [Canna indica]
MEAAGRRFRRYRAFLVPRSDSRRGFLQEDGGRWKEISAISCFLSPSIRFSTRVSSRTRWKDYELNLAQLIHCAFPTVKKIPSVLSSIEEYFESFAVSLLEKTPSE